MIQNIILHPFRNILIRLGIHYLAVLVGLGAVFLWVPQIPYYVAMERVRGGEGGLLEAGRGVSGERADLRDAFPMLTDEEVDELTAQELARLLDNDALGEGARPTAVLFSLVMAFVVALPVAWVYRWTRSPKKFSQAFSHTLLVIPIAIALVVFLVKGSLALAFSLAGIVAAVRFRSSLQQPMDAVYMMTTIGIGLAAGTQLFKVAYLGSVTFVIIALGVWRSNWGARPVVLSGWTLTPSVGQESEPGANAKAIAADKRSMIGGLGCLVILFLLLALLAFLTISPAE